MPTQKATTRARVPSEELPSPHMSPDEYRAALARLGFARSHASNDEGFSEAARFFGANARSGQNWAAAGPPAAVVLFLQLMTKLALDYDEVRAILAGPARRRR